MADKNFYLRKASEAVLGSQTFSDLISASPTTYGLVTGQATSFAALNTILQAAWIASETSTTRTEVAIEARNVALANMREAAKALNGVIRANGSVTNAQLIELGFLPRTSPSPIPPDMTAPEVDVIDVKNRIVTVRVRQIAGEGKARPASSIGAYLFTATGPTPPADANGYKFVGTASKAVTEIVFDDDVASGSTVWIAAAWAYPRGVRSFACEPVSTTIQGGPVLASA